MGKRTFLRKKKKKKRKIFQNSVFWLKIYFFKVFDAIFKANKFYKDLFLK